MMRSILLCSLLLLGCNNAADARFIAQFREDGIRSCMRGDGLMRPHWAVPPNRLEQSCNCIVDAYMEGHTRRQLAHLSVDDQLRARERCSGGAPEGAGPGDEMDNIAAIVIKRAEANTAEPGK